MTDTAITIEATINAPIEKVWQYWTEPEHITQWSFASDEWHTPNATNDLREGGQFSSTMAAKDGSMSFDFAGVYTKVDAHKLIEYKLGDERAVSVKFTANGNETKVVETFDAESQHPIDMQRAGWQAILNNFKRHVESN